MQRSKDYVSVRIVDDIAVVYLVEDLFGGDAIEFKQLLMDLADKYSKLIIHLGERSYISDETFGIMIAIHKKSSLNDISLGFVLSTEKQLDFVEITGWKRLINIFDSVDDALNEFTS